MAADRIVLTFPAAGNLIAAVPLRQLAEHRKISAATRDLALHLLREISLGAARANPSRAPHSTVVLELQPSPKKIIVSVTLRGYGAISEPTAAALAQLHPSIVVKAAKAKVTFTLPPRL